MRIEWLGDVPIEAGDLNWESHELYEVHNTELYKLVAQRYGQPLGLSLITTAVLDEMILLIVFDDDAPMELRCSVQSNSERELFNYLRGMC